MKQQKTCLISSACVNPLHTINFMKASLRSFFYDSLATINGKGTCLQDFLEIVKHSLHNF